MRVQIKKLQPDAMIPKYQTSGAAGADVYSLEDALVQPGKSHLFATGVAIQPPHGYEFQVRPRSGLAFEKLVTVLNSPGTVDHDFQGHLQILLVNHGTMPVPIKKGMRIAQIVLNEIKQAVFEEVEEFDQVTDRGTNGFGSTGR